MKSNESQRRALNATHNVRAKKPPPWTMPPELEPYRELICNTGGLSIEELMRRSREPDCNVVVNAPLALICQAVESQITLLKRLQNAGKLP